MKKIRAVVELSVPDGHNFTEADFVKSLRRSIRGRTIFSLAPTYKESRPIQFKEFGRVVQYDPQGNRIAPPKPPANFEKLVLIGLWIIGYAVLTPAAFSRSKRAQEWFAEVRAAINEKG